MCIQKVRKEEVTPLPYLVGTLPIWHGAFMVGSEALKNAESVCFFKKQLAQRG